MISCDRVIIVEGKYDKITVENVVDATVVATDGFRVFKDESKRKLIKKLAEKKGIAVLTDSDSAGLQIRNYIKNICENADIVNVYIPKLAGKEKRKAAPSKEGFLGVEGMNAETIARAFERSGIIAKESEKKPKKVTKQDLFTLGLSGVYDSAKQREELSLFLDIPSGMSSSAFLDAVNSLYTYDEFERQVLLWRQETDKK